MQAPIVKEAPIPKKPAIAASKRASLMGAAVAMSPLAVEVLKRVLDSDSAVITTGGGPGA